MLDFNPGEHICVVGDARPEKTNPIYLAHEKVILILVVERATGLIVDADTNMVCELTRRFLRSVFVGHSLVAALEEIRNSRPGGGKSRLPEQETDFFRILMPQRRFHGPGGATAPDAIRFCGRPFFHVYRQ